jgi:hypothetical protein
MPWEFGLVDYYSQYRTSASYNETFSEGSSALRTHFGFGAEFSIGGLWFV